MEPRMLTTEPVNEPDEASVVEPPAAQDLDPATWLARDEGNVTGRVPVRGGALRVGALTQGEMTLLRKQASKPGRQGDRIVDPDLLNRYVISFAMAKGKNPAGIPPELLAEAEGYLKPLNSKLTGELTEIARKILKLSGFVDDEERANLEEMFPAESGEN